MNTVREIQVLVHLSFLAQFFLVLFAPRRHRTNKKWLVMLISAIYFFANWIAPYAIGVISNQQICSRSCRRCPAAISGNILVFWATFLLLHLGSPSNITSLSLAENDMWLKKFVELGSNVITATLVFSRATPSNLLFPASFLVLLVGTVKYAERTLTLFLGRSDRWHSIAALVENTELSRVEENLPTLQSVLDKLGRISLSNKEMLQLALCFYEQFKGFLVRGGSYKPRLRNFTRNFFLKANIFQAFELVEIELSFIHEDLHTRAGVTPPIIGYTIRMASLISIITAFILFYLHDKHEIAKIDIGITYVLLLSALLLEIISFVMVLFSVRGILALGCETDACNSLQELIFEAMVFRRGWSNSFSRWNLMNYCLSNSRGVTNKLIDQLTIREALKDFEIKRTLTSGGFYSFPKYDIFQYLWKISGEAGENVKTAKEKCSGRGILAVREFDCENLIGWSLGGADYAVILLRWHIATDICIRIAPSRNMFFDYDVRSVKLSEYLLYLLLWKPSLIAPAAGYWEPIFQQAYAEARQFFHEKSNPDPKEALETLLSEVIDPPLPGGGENESMWKDACRLAKQLIDNFGDRHRWNLILAVWIELLVYAAFNSKVITHIRQLEEGGEVLTVVWLLMNHLGLGKHFSEAPAWDP